jgi:DNA recombination-dependent growth factor C
MPLTSGTVTCRVYTLSDRPKGQFLAEALAEAKRFAFRPPQAERGQTRSIGWVNIRNVLDADLNPEKMQFEDFVVLGLRVDKVSVNARVLKAHFMEAVQKALKEKRKTQLGREERAALLEQVRTRLLAKQTPSTSVYEMAWNTKTHRVYFAATSESLNAEFCDLFHDTFHSTPIPLFPYLRAETKSKREGTMAELLESDAALMSPFVGVVRTYEQEGEE